MSGYSIVQDYRHPLEKVWRAVTAPELIPRWTAEGRGGRPVGFEPVVGTRFKYVAKPMPGWDGVVRCEVLEVQEPNLLRYSWMGGEEDDRTLVTCRLEAHDGGTRLTWEHTGFTGIGGFIVSRILASVRKKMLLGLEGVLAAMA